MGTEGPKDSLDWKTIGDSGKNDPKKMRHIPDYYFLPRRSMLANTAIYGSCIVGGIGAGMLTDIWINKKVQEDGNVNNMPSPLSHHQPNRHCHHHCRTTTTVAPPPPLSHHHRRCKFRSEAGFAGSEETV